MTDAIRVLYVDDEEDLLNLGKAFLEDFGEFSVDTAHSASAARTILNDGIYDAIVSDYQMPVEDGITFLKSVRGTYGTIPFILFTGRGREEVVIEAINNGVDFYLQKGGDVRSQFAELAHKIRQAVVRHNDAVQRKIAEDALRESEAKFSRLFQSSPTCLALIDITGNVFTDINDAFIRNTGYSREELIGRSPESVGLYADRETPGKIRNALMNGRDVSSWEVRFRNKNGEIHTCLFSVVQITVDGKPYSLSSVEDITQRKAMEAEILEGRCLLEEAMDLANMAYWERDPHTGVFVFNDRFYALYGTTAEREGGYRMDMATYMREFVHPADRAMVFDEIRKSTGLNGRIYGLFIEHRIIRRDGAIRDIVVSTKVTSDSEGNPVMIRGVNQDITFSRGTGIASRQSRLSV